ncbi:hypothetical protein HanIR_Chr17g0889181 [Helianthus annuus]|nr:hypothetical protein HanIR_Chr17g0889181 [Helianthus annuus]
MMLCCDLLFILFDLHEVVCFVVRLLFLGCIFTPFVVDMLLK